MSNTTYLCIDKSGSTRGARKYWQEVGEIMEINRGAKVIFWDMEAHETGFTQGLGNVKQGKMGDGGTDPQCFATLLPEDIHLVIVTDGQVPAECIKGCDGILQGRKFAQVEVHYLSTGGEMNLSVSAPFTRKTNYQIFVDGNILAEGNSIESIELEPYFDEPEKFILESDEIVKKIVIQNLGQNNSSLRNGLLNLQKNLLNCIAKRSSSENEDKFAGIREMLKKGEYEKAIEAFKNDILAKLAIGSGNMATQIEAIIRDLTNLCSGDANYSFDLLQPGRLKRAAGIAPVRVEELPTEQEYEGKYECPIMLDREMPCCMVKEGEPVFKDLEKKYLDDLMTNPLMLLQNSELIEKLRQRIDLAIGQQSLKSIFAHNDDFYGQILSPFTRAPICGAFTFGLDGTHSRSNNFVLANLFFGANKLVGLPELWIAVVYFVIRDKVAYLSEDAEFMTAFREHLVHRMERKMTNVTLSGLPIEPFMKSPVDIAIWYCVVSPHLQKWTSTESAANRLRSMGVSAKWLLELLDLMGMAYDREWTVHRLALYKAFAGMMRAEKDPPNKGKWRKILRGQYQNSTQIAGNEGTISIVMLDGPPQANAEMRPKLPDTRIFPSDADLGLGELLALAELVDPRKSINDVEIPEKLEIKPTPHFVENYGYLENDAPSKLSAVQICPKTMRPYSHDLKSGLQWKIASENAFGPLDKQISLNNYFGKYVVEKDKYPESKTEFILYLAAKQENRGDGNAKDTLPAQIAGMVDALFRRFEEVAGKNFANVSIEKFRKRFQASANLEIRAKLDGTAKMG